jgi:isoamylase
MLLGGDEFGRTQKGNNNAYCQDNEISWVNWEIDEDARVLTDFVRKLTGFFHKYPVLRRSRFLSGEVNKAIDVKDVAWVAANGSEMTVAAWDDETTRCFGMLLDGRGQATGIIRRGGDVTLLLVFNAHHEVADFKLPPCTDASGWRRLVDTADPNLPEQRFRIGAIYKATARSLLLFERVAARTRKIASARGEAERNPSAA